jgi:hypothetical protein
MFFILMMISIWSAGRMERISVITRMGAGIRYSGMGSYLGATTPGHFPGELSPTYDDYRRWFSDMENLGIQVVRVYTILPPGFYQALMDHNKSARKKLWFIQGIWPPEDELAKDKNAYLQSITQLFEKEISLAVKAVYGQGEIAPLPVKASGDYQVIRRHSYMFGLDGKAGNGTQCGNVIPIRTTSIGNRFQADILKTTDLASPFEAWLAVCLRSIFSLGKSDEEGWAASGFSFVNWVTTDPLSHPDEPLQIEDMASVDPMPHYATDTWMAGYFAAYHVIPIILTACAIRKNIRNLPTHRKKGSL